MVAYPMCNSISTFFSERQPYFYLIFPNKTTFSPSILSKPFGSKRFATILGVMGGVGR